MRFHTLHSSSVRALRSLLCLLFAAGCTGGEEPVDTDMPLEPTPEMLAGRWVSDGCEAYPNGDGNDSYLTRDFVLTTTEWHLDLVIHGNADCSFPLFRAEIDGTYTLGEASEVPDAREGQFHIDQNFWTAEIQDMADLFTDSACGGAPWTVGESQDVAITGCIGLAHAASECPDGEHDLVSVQPEGLYFGERSVNLCEERPAALGPFPLGPQP